MKFSAMPRTTMNCMKNITLTLLAVLISGCLFAQAQDSVKKDHYIKYGYYMMHPDYVIHYLASKKADTLFADVSLPNGQTLTSRGELLEKKGKKIFLKEGECLNANGNADDCDKLKKRLEKKTETK
jgi:uncharacterized protein DUF6799